MKAWLELPRPAAALLQPMAPGHSTLNLPSHTAAMRARPPPRAWPGSPSLAPRQGLSARPVAHARGSKRERWYPKGEPLSDAVGFDAGGRRTGGLGFGQRARKKAARRVDDEDEVAGVQHPPLGTVEGEGGWYGDEEDGPVIVGGVEIAGRLEDLLGMEVALAETGRYERLPACLCPVGRRGWS